MSENKEACLELIGVGKNFRGIRANDNINLKVSQGERLAIIGPNGAGKTTLFNMISGDLELTDGRILMYGEDVTKLKIHKRVMRGLARTYQITELFSDVSVIENVLLALLGTNRKKFSLVRHVGRFSKLFGEAQALLAQFGLEDKKDDIIANLSYGDQRLIELVLAIASKPKILCLDEPNAGLSVSESRHMVRIIRNLSRDITLLLIEHDMDMVFEVVDRIMVMKDGVMVADDTTENIRNNPQVQEIYLGEA